MAKAKPRKRNRAARVVLLPVEAPPPAPVVDGFTLEAPAGPVLVQALATVVCLQEWASPSGPGDSMAKDSGKPPRGKKPLRLQQLDTTIPPHLGMRGRGRPTKLTREMMDDVCRLLAMGLPIQHACAATGIVRSIFYLWKAKGEKDAKSGMYTLLAEFSDRVQVYESVGAAGIWNRVLAGTVVIPNDPETSKAKANAGRLALAAYNTRYGGRSDLPAPVVEEDEESGSGLAMTSTPQAMDWSRLTQEEWRMYASLTRKLRGQE